MNFSFALSALSLMVATAAITWVLITRDTIWYLEARIQQLEAERLDDLI
jgi:hypothetical protein